jgi:hypothetical protein
MADCGLWEVPVSVSSLLRLPMVGTFVLGGRGVLLREATATRYLHLELHGLDLVDAAEVAEVTDAALVRKAPELRTPLATRQERLRGLLRARQGATSIGGAFAS